MCFDCAGVDGLHVHPSRKDVKKAPKKSGFFDLFGDFCFISLMSFVMNVGDNERYKLLQLCFPAALRPFYCHLLAERCANILATAEKHPPQNECKHGITVTG